jgi:dethiobiotin synthetase
MKKLFITATDTDAGKTFVSCALIEALTQQTRVNLLTVDNIRVAAFKPVAAGCELMNNQLINEDAKLLSEYANCGQSIKEINPIAFFEPIAPHIAAKQNNQHILIDEIAQHFTRVSALQADFTLVEGAGGWRLPLGEYQNQQQFMSDFVKLAKLDVILVVNMKLGCLNHALLTFEAIKADGLHCIAWVANCASPEPMNNLTQNIDELKQLLPVPMIAKFAYLPQENALGEPISLTDNIALAASQLDISPLLN